MADDGLAGEAAARRYAVLRPHLDERQRRLLLGAEAPELGRGGIKAVAVATGVHPDTVARGARELRGPRRAGRAGAGARGWAVRGCAETDPGLAPALTALVDPETRGDPMSPLVWTTKSTRNLAAALTAGGHPVVRPDGGPDAARAGVQPAGQRQGHRGTPARRPRRPVPLPQRRRSASI